jgi:hypothetical protein
VKGRRHEKAEPTHEMGHPVDDNVDTRPNQFYHDWGHDTFTVPTKPRNL